LGAAWARLGRGWPARPRRDILRDRVQRRSGRHGSEEGGCRWDGAALPVTGGTRPFAPGVWPLPSGGSKERSGHMLEAIPCSGRGASVPGQRGEPAHLREGIALPAAGGEGQTDAEVGRAWPMIAGIEGLPDNGRVGRGLPSSGEGEGRPCCGKEWAAPQSGMGIWTGPVAGMVGPAATVAAEGVGRTPGVR